MQVRRSREVVRLLSSTLLHVSLQLSEEGKAQAEGNLVAMFEKFQELSSSADYTGVFDSDALALALKM